MSWISGNQKIIKKEDFNSIVKEYSGELDDVSARITLIKFLKANLGFTFELLTGIKLFPFQEVIIKSLFIRDNALIVGARGIGKSFLISAFSLLYPIFHPNSKGCVLSANFRSARRIMEYNEKLINGKGADLLRACYPNQMRRATDMYRLDIPNGSELFALPLSSDGIRGTRASFILLDEGLLISKDVQEIIIRPFLTVKQDAKEEMEISKIEDELIAGGSLKEEDRISFPKNKYLVFSSASYKFEYLYKMYKDYLENIISPPVNKNNPTYVTMRLSYEAAPSDYPLEMTQINSAKANGGEYTDYFRREYQAIFSDAGNSYFNVKRLHECTVPPNEFPTVQLRGEKGFQYILTIDPSYTASKTSDYFAMGVYLIVPEERKIILVHTYGKAGGELKDHFCYLTYILTQFNIVFIAIDNSGSEFIHGYNESVVSKERNIKLEFMDVNFESDEYLKEIRLAKSQYNLMSRKIIWGQPFYSQAIRRMNEHLQNQVEARKVWFGSKIQANNMAIKKAKLFEFPFDFKDKNDQIYEIHQFIEDQDSWIDETKTELAYIEVRTTSSGILQYGLPKGMDSGDDKMRKDLYTCLLMASSAAKFFFDMNDAEEEDVQETFDPIILR